MDKKKIKNWDYQGNMRHLKLSKMKTMTIKPNCCHQVLGNLSSKQWEKVKEQAAFESWTCVGIGTPLVPCKAQFLNGKASFLFLLSFPSKPSDNSLGVSFFGAWQRGVLSP